MAVEASRAYARALSREDAITQASTFLGHVVLWNRDELSARLGEHAQGPWLLRIDRPTPALFTISLRTTPDGPALLWTAVYREARR
ncbi:MAG: hypothetical protein HY275_13380 [Gemmatimonadetes bacterium]|nr:hypothetical protein [Gemmatimonadota bacterium]